MATPKGMRYSTSGLLQRLSSQPIAQQEVAQAMRQDNRAISGLSRTLGKQVAGEHQRLMSLDEFGADLAFRKDKLAFARKVQKDQEKHFQDQMKLRDEKLNYADRNMMIEAGLGLASTGVEAWNTWKSKKESEAWKEQQQDLYDVVMANAKGNEEPVVYHHEERQTPDEQLSDETTGMTPSNILPLTRLGMFQSR